MKIQKPEKIHAYEGITTTPNVHEHYCKRIAKKHKIYKKCDYLLTVAKI